MTSYINTRAIIAATDVGEQRIEVRLMDGSRWSIWGYTAWTVFEEREPLKAEPIE